MKLHARIFDWEEARKTNARSHNNSWCYCYIAEKRKQHFFFFDILYEIVVSIQKYCCKKRKKIKQRENKKRGRELSLFMTFLYEYFLCFQKFFRSLAWKYFQPFKRCRKETVWKPEKKFTQASSELLFIFSRHGGRYYFFLKLFLLTLNVW